MPTVSDSAKRIVVLSDTHFGKPGEGGAGSPDTLRPLWQGADEVVINGDVAEIHDVGCRGDAARAVLRLQDLCDEDGVHLCLLSGNHDPYITDRRYLRLFGGEVFLVHGDILHPAISPWTPYAKRLQALHDDAVASLDPEQRDTLDGALSVSQHASHVKWDESVTEEWVKRNWVQGKWDKAEKILKVLWYWQTLPRRAAVFAEQYASESRFFVFGHIHRAGIWHSGDRKLINTGAYELPGRPRAVRIEDGQLSVWAIRRAGDCFAYGSKPLASYALRGAA